MTPILDHQLPKIRSFPIKTKVKWALGVCRFAINSDSLLSSYSNHTSDTYLGIIKKVTDNIFSLQAHTNIHHLPGAPQTIKNLVFPSKQTGFGM